MNQLDQILTDSGSDFDAALRAILTDFKAEIGTIHTLGADGLLHMRAFTAGIPEPVLAATKTIPVGKGMAGLAVERKTPISMCDLQQDSSGAARPGAAATGAGGSICVPLMAEEKAVGALGIATRGERTFTDEETKRLLHAASLLARHA